MRVLDIEVPGSNSGKKFFRHFLCTFLPRGYCSIRVSRSCNFTHGWRFCYNSMTVSVILSNDKRFALRWLLHVQTDFQVISSNGLPSGRDKKSLLIFFENHV